MLHDQAHGETTDVTLGKTKSLLLTTCKLCVNFLIAISCEIHADLVCVSWPDPTFFGPAGVPGPQLSNNRQVVYVQVLLFGMNFWTCEDLYCTLLFHAVDDQPPCHSSLAP